MDLRKRTYSIVEGKATNARVSQCNVTPLCIHIFSYNVNEDLGLLNTSDNIIFIIGRLEIRIN